MEKDLFFAFYKKSLPKEFQHSVYGLEYKKK